jgi:Flp pilus assembly protein TadG
MPRSSPSTETEPNEADRDDPERGSAALEFIVVGMILLVSLVYLVVALGLIQGQALGVEAGARHIARVVSLSTDAASARGTAAGVLDSVVDEYGIDPDAVHLDLACLPAGAACPRAGATLVVTIRTTVALPLVPHVLGLDRLASIPVGASSAQKVSRFWGTG